MDFSVQVFLDKDVDNHYKKAITCSVSYFYLDFGNYITYLHFYVYNLGYGRRAALLWRLVDDSLT